MTITRTTLLGGPAAAIWGGRTYFAASGILVTPALELEAVDSDAQGVLDSTATLAAPVTIQFAPSAPFADLVALYPWLEGAPGTSLFGSGDSPLVLIAANGVRLTFAAAALVQMPDLVLSTSGAVAGGVNFLAKGARALPITAANRLVTIDTAEFPALPTASNQLADDFAIMWGSEASGPWTGLRALNGVSVQFAMKTTPVRSAANALLDVTLDSLTVTVRFTPGSVEGPAEADVLGALQLQGADAVPGRLLSTAAQTLDIAGEHLWLRLPLAQLVAGPLVFDAKKPQVGELVFRATRALLAAEEAVAALATFTEGEPAE
jgi:hypothetical protein